MNAITPIESLALLINVTHANFDVIALEDHEERKFTFCADYMLRAIYYGLKYKDWMPDYAAMVLYYFINTYPKFQMQLSSRGTALQNHLSALVTELDPMMPFRKTAIFVPPGSLNSTTPQ
jgi:hypothetical protein